MPGSIAERLPLTLLSPSGARARLLILTFHRVLATPDPLMPDDPHAQFFGEQMRWLAAYCRVLPLSQAVPRLAEGTLPARACCITFDDGYANNAEIAAPILQKLRLSATVFIATDALERGIMWNDVVFEAVRRAGPVLRAADVALLGMEHRDLAANAAAVDAILDHLKYRPVEERWQCVMQFFRRIAGGEPPRLMMTADALRGLARTGFEIGAHTVHHPILARQSPEDARREIVDSRHWIAATTGTAPTAFAYPNGRPGRDYDATHVQMVREAGFSLAVSTSWGCAMRSSDRFQLPRLAFWDRARWRYWLRLVKTYASSYVA